MTYPGELKAATAKSGSPGAKGFSGISSMAPVARLKATGLRWARNISSPPWGMERVFSRVRGTSASPAMPTAAYPSSSKISPAESAARAVTIAFAVFGFPRRAVRLRCIALSRRLPSVFLPLISQDGLTGRKKFHPPLRKFPEFPQISHKSIETRAPQVLYFRFPPPRPGFRPGGRRPTGDAAVQRPPPDTRRGGAEAGFRKRKCR